jgi:hypothetical protein
MNFGIFKESYFPPFSLSKLKVSRFVRKLIELHVF